MLPDDLVTPERVAGLTALLGSAVVKATAVLLLGSVCVLLARSASAATRHLIWVLTLGGALVVPVAAELVPKWHVPLLRWPVAQGWDAPAAATSVPLVASGASSNAVLALAPRAVAVPGQEPQVVVRHVAPASAVGQAAPVIQAVPVMPAVLAPPASVPSTAGTPQAVAGGAAVAAAPPMARNPAALVPALARLWALTARWAVAAWIVGAIIAFAPTLIGLVRLALLGRRARPMRGGRWALLVPSAMREIDVRRRVRFIELDEPVMPMTWGILRPVVLLPSGDFDSSIAQRLDVLRHELAHIRRYDCLTQLVGQIACAVHWFNPLAWIAAKQLRVERERACDDEVLRAGAKASDYADYLLRVARSMHAPAAAAFGGLAMARPSQLAGRLLAVLDDRRQRERLSVRAAARASGVTALAVAVVASASPMPVAAAAGSASAPVASAAPTQTITTTVATGLRVTPLAVDAEGARPRATENVLPPDVSWTTTSSVASPTPVVVGNLTASLPVTVVRGAPCDRTTRSGKGSSHTNWTSSENGSKRWRVLWSEGDCSYEIEARGEIKYNRDVTDVESISTGGSFTIEQHIGDNTRRLAIRPRSDSGLDRSYSVNGARREYDADAQAWFAEALVALDRQTAFAVDQRVPSILERSGVDGVLQEISLLGSDYARRRYYTKLLSMRQLDRTQVRRVVEQAGSEMSSDYELAELLVALAKLDAFGDDSHTAFVAAVKKIDSDYEARRALNALLRREQLAPATVQALLDVSTTIGSDYELAELLIDVSKRYAINDQTRPMYIKAVGSIQSDYEHRRVLAAIVAGGGLTPAATRALLEDAGRIASDYELAEFLIQVAGKGGLDATTRDAYFAATAKIDSDYEHHRALTPLLKRDLLTKDIAKGILESATKIDSDYECASLLVEVANAITIDAELRPAFDRAADTIQGEYEYGRAMSAVRRRATR
jgi:beta-lactamase regulating signal transducer with metallopeptidase domain